MLSQSGSGKLMLIDVQADRIVKGRLNSTITLNGTSSCWHLWLLKAISTYVMEDDFIFYMFIVEETLTFSIDFYLPCSHLSCAPCLPLTTFEVLRAPMPAQEALVEFYLCHEAWLHYSNYYSHRHQPWRRIIDVVVRFWENYSSGP